jgi:hypothetical protein
LKRNDCAQNVRFSIILRGHDPRIASRPAEDWWPLFAWTMATRERENEIVLLRRPANLTTSSHMRGKRQAIPFKMFASDGLGDILLFPLTGLR